MKINPVTVKKCPITAGEETVTSSEQELFIPLAWNSSPSNVTPALSQVSLTLLLTIYSGARGSKPHTHKMMVKNNSKPSTKRKLS